MTQPSVPIDEQPLVLAASADRQARVDEVSPRVAWVGLAWTLVRTDFKARYHGTLSGFAWALL